MMATESNESSKVRLNWLMGALYVTIFLTQLDQTIVSTALPSIVAKLDGYEHMNGVFTVYMLASTVVMPIGGKLSDLYGRKRFFYIGLLVFMAGSALCGMAGSMPELVVYRAVQGIGAGLLVPVTFTLVFSFMPKVGAGVYQTLYMGVFALSSVVGPALGAAITQTLDWRWNFFINLPLGALALIVLLKLLPDIKPEASVKPQVDWAGSAALAAATLAVLLGLKLAEEGQNWASPGVILLFAAGAAAAAGFFYAERRAKEPVLPPELIRDKVISGTLLATFFQGMMMYGALLYIPLFVQGTLGGDAGDTGGALTPLMFCVMLGAIFTSPLIRRRSWRFNITAAMASTGLGLLLMIYMPYDVNPWLMRCIMALIGIGIGMMMMIGQLAVSMGVEERIKGAATSSVGFARSIGGVFGTAVLSSLVNTKFASLIESEGFLTSGAGEQKLADPQALLEESSGLAPEALEQLRLALGEAVQWGFWFLVAAAAMGILISLRLGSARQLQGKAEEKPSAGSVV